MLKKKKKNKNKVHALNHHFTLLSVPCLNEEASAKVYE